MSYESSDPNSFEFLPGRLYYVPVSTTPVPHPQRHYFTIDHQLQYWNFFLDFGPLNLGQLYRFCSILNQKLSHSKLRDKIIYYYSGSHPHKRTNAAFLISAWAMICLNKTPEEAFKPFKSIAHSFPPWHDATQGVCTFNLTIMDTLNGLYKARQNSFFDFNKFPIDEYEHYERVENGDLNWCLEGKFIMFAGPHGGAGGPADNSHDTSGFQQLSPENYIEYFKFRNVTLVIRLNKKYYDARSFTNAGIDHCDLYFLDGSNPPDHILAKFIQKCEDTPGAVAVHCKAGLGRTGSTIGCYIMKHYNFTAEELIGWLRICRPGAIIGPQQHWIKSMQQRMWREGELYRTKLQQLELAYKPGPLDHLSAASEIDSDMNGNHINTGRRSARRGMNSARGAPNSARNSANISLSSKMALLNVVNTYDAINTQSSKNNNIAAAGGGNSSHNNSHQSMNSARNSMSDHQQQQQIFSARNNSNKNLNSARLSNRINPTASASTSSVGSARGTGNQSVPYSSSRASATRPVNSAGSAALLSPRSAGLAAMSDSTQTFTSQQENDNKSQADYLLARRLAKQQQQSSSSSSSAYDNNGNNGLGNSGGCNTAVTKLTPRSMSSSNLKLNLSALNNNSNSNNKMYSNGSSVGTPKKIITPRSTSFNNSSNSNTNTTQFPNINNNNSNSSMNSSPATSVDENGKRKSRFGSFLSTFTSSSHSHARK